MNAVTADTNGLSAASAVKAMLGVGKGKAARNGSKREGVDW